MRYFIEPRCKKKWFSKEVSVVWDLMENYKHWTYGYTGGYYAKAVRRIHTFDNKGAAERILKQLTEE